MMELSQQEKTRVSFVGLTILEMVMLRALKLLSTAAVENL